MKKLIVSSVIASCIFGSGCSSLATKPIDKPVVIESFKKPFWPWKHDQYESVLLTPERRQILIKYKNGDADPDEEVLPDVICSEAPSDTGLKIDTLIKTSIEGKVPEKGEGKIDFGNQSNTANVALHSKAQSIKYINAVAHAYCNMYMNGILTKKEYKESIGKFLDQSMKVLIEELPLYYQTVAITSKASEKAPKNKTSGDNSGKDTSGGDDLSLQPYIDKYLLEKESLKNFPNPLGN